MCFLDNKNPAPPSAQRIRVLGANEKKETTAGCTSLTLQRHRLEDVTEEKEDLLVSTVSTTPKKQNATRSNEPNRDSISTDIRSAPAAQANNDTTSSNPFGVLLRAVPSFLLCRLGSLSTVLWTTKPGGCEREEGQGHIHDPPFVWEQQ